jgi:SAM-dependent methyltransferase
MTTHRRVLAAVFIVLLASSALAQTPAGGQLTDLQVYETFRAWITKQPIDERGNALERYRKVLAEQGVQPPEIDRRIKVIGEQGRKLEVDLWNRVLTSPKPGFNTRPNQFLVRMTEGRKPGRALDVGMGQGRNAIYLAQQGWTVTGFDPADKAVALAQQEAKRLGVSLATQIVGDEAFDFGRDQWDLIVLSYVGLRPLIARVYDSLKPGGIVVVEGFHDDATKESAIGGAVVFATNELLELFERFRIVQYEDTQAVGDFGMRNTRVVRLAAEKR